jgi:hypothetical protein
MGSLEDVKARLTRCGQRSTFAISPQCCDGISPLQCGQSNTGNLEIAGYLLEHGAKANIRSFEKLTPHTMMDSDATPEMFALLLRFMARRFKSGRTRRKNHYPPFTPPKMMSRPTT